MQLHHPRTSSPLNTIRFKGENILFVIHHLVHTNARLLRHVYETANDPGRYTHSHTMRWQIGYHQGTSANLSSFANQDRSQYSGTSTQQDTVAHLWMAHDTFFAGSSQCDVMENTAIVS